MTIINEQDTSFKDAVINELWSQLECGSVTFESDEGDRTITLNACMVEVVTDFAYEYAEVLHDKVSGLNNLAQHLNAKSMKLAGKKFDEAVKDYDEEITEAANKMGRG